MNGLQPNRAPIILIGAALIPLVLLPQAHALPDGADWATADDPQGCRSCHLGEPVVETPDALTIDGLPTEPEPGKSYQLTIRLMDAALKNAGFLLSVVADGEPAGEISASDAGVATNGSQARSNWDSQFPPAPGEASWTLIWTAPAALPRLLTFDLWGNAGNDDLSPLGDRPHHRIWQIPAAP